MVSLELPKHRSPTSGSEELLGSLERTCAREGLPSLASKLGGIARRLEPELAILEEQVESICRGPSNLAEHAVAHLLAQPGKRVRPVCVLLTASLGGTIAQDARLVALVAELVHNATLLHDDVVDMGDTRRGQPTARVLYGNAASVFAGDWLLVHALQRIASLKQPEYVDRLLRVIDVMIAGEVKQLELRRDPSYSIDDYLEVVNAKTAALFRFCLWSGARLANQSEEVLKAMDQLGRYLGTAFQVADDVLDFAGDPNDTGKNLFADLQEGKYTYPLLVGLREVPHLSSLLGSARESIEICQEIGNNLVNVGAIEESLRFAKQQAALAKNSLARLPRGPVRTALGRVIDGCVKRSR